VAISTGEQVNFATGLTITTGGVPVTYPDGTLLPPATLPADVAARAALRSAGLVRLVTVATTAADFAAVEQAAGAVTAAVEGDPLPETEGVAGDVIANY
jgi:hypothetical protein